MGARIGSLIIGVWLVLAPRILDYSNSAATANETWIGLAVIAAGLVAFRTPEFLYVNLGFGAWLALSPLLLLYRDRSATANSVVVGILLVLTSAVARASLEYFRREPIEV